MTTLPDRGRTLSYACHTMRGGSAAARRASIWRRRGCSGLGRSLWSRRVKSGGRRDVGWLGVRHHPGQAGAGVAGFCGVSLRGQQAAGGHRLGGRLEYRRVPEASGEDDAKDRDCGCQADRSACTSVIRSSSPRRMASAPSIPSATSAASTAVTRRSCARGQQRRPRSTAGQVRHRPVRPLHGRLQDPHRQRMWGAGRLVTGRVLDVPFDPVWVGSSGTILAPVLAGGMHVDTPGYPDWIVTALSAKIGVRQSGSQRARETDNGKHTRVVRDGRRGA